MLKSLKASPILPWLVVFILANLLFREYGATNEMSRYATMRAISDQGTFKINALKDWTVDWAIKDGNIYSNKAPGPMLLGLPLFYPLDQISKFDRKDKKDENGHRITMVSSTPRVIMALFYQILPFAFLVFLVSAWMRKKQSLPPPSIHFFALACLFGNTAAIFMNFFFGHGMTALFVLALGFALLKRQYIQVGLFFGLALLTEYTASLLLPGLVFALFLLKEEKKMLMISKIIKGGIFPGILWSYYHYATVGSPFKIPAQFQNPMWIDQSAAKEKLWGMFDLPDLEVIFKLLFGFERGILWTQPWILGAISIALYLLFSRSIKREMRSLSLFLLISFSLLITMNSSFNGWHGGATSGPRYLSMLFPCFALLTALHFDKLRAISKNLIWGALGFSLLFRILVYGSRATAPEDHNLWPWLFQDLLEKDGMKGELRALVMVTLLSTAAWFVSRKKSTSDLLVDTNPDSQHTS